MYYGMENLLNKEKTMRNFKLLSAVALLSAASLSLASSETFLIFESNHDLLPGPECLSLGGWAVHVLLQHFLLGYCLMGLGSYLLANLT